jgi:hypothetical protein
VRQPESPEEGDGSVALTDSGTYWTLVLPVVPAATLAFARRKGPPSIRETALSVRCPCLVDFRRYGRLGTDVWWDEPGYQAGFAGGFSGRGTVIPTSWRIGSFQRPVCQFAPGYFLTGRLA